MILYRAMYEAIAVHSRLGLNVVVDVGAPRRLFRAARNSPQLCPATKGSAGVIRGRALPD